MGNLLLVRIEQALCQKRPASRLAGDRPAGTVGQITKIDVQAEHFPLIQGTASQFGRCPGVALNADLARLDNSCADSRPVAADGSAASCRRLSKRMGGLCWSRLESAPWLRFIANAVAVCLTDPGPNSERWRQMQCSKADALAVIGVVGFQQRYI